MTNTTPTITLADDPADTTARFRQEIAGLEATRAKVEADAIKADDAGHGAQKLARLEDDLRLARAKLAAAERAETTALDRAASPKAIAAVLAEFEADPALGIDGINEAATTIETAVGAYFEKVATRAAAIEQWRRRLIALGVPSSGMSVDGEPVSVGQYAIEAKGGQVVPIDSPANYVAYIIEQATRGHQVTGKQDPRLSLPAHDTRAARTDHLSIVLSRDLGGHARGARLSTRTGSTALVLTQLVRNGHATVVEGHPVDGPAKP